LNRASLETIAKATKGGYVNGNNTKEVLAYIKSTLDNIQKPNLSRRKLPIFNHSFNGSRILHLFVVFDLFLLEKKTNWVKKLNLFNEEK
jgi:Ca-activated chloride channel family protein